MTVLFHAVAVLVGAAVSLATVAVHRSEVLGVPLGLVLGLLATFTTSWAMREMHPRLATSYALGWVVAFGTAILGKPEGDYAIASDLSGYVLMATALVVVVVGVSSLATQHSGSRPGAT
jgi:hypothetical protein